jgi:hypothetical protein
MYSEVAGRGQLHAGEIGLPGQTRDVLRDGQAPRSLGEVIGNSQGHGFERELAAGNPALQADDVEAVLRLYRSAGCFSRFQPA